MKPDEPKSGSEVTADASMFRSLDDLIADKPLAKSQFRLEDCMMTHIETEEEKTQALLVAIIATL